MNYQCAAHTSHSHFHSYGYTLQAYYSTSKLMMSIVLDWCQTIISKYEIKLALIYTYNKF